MNYQVRTKLFIAFSLLMFLAGCTKSPTLTDTTKNKKADQSYGVSSSNPQAIKVGMDILKNGGTAADAAIAVSYVLGVTEPFGSGVGGGGGMLIVTDSGKADFIDYRETSPEDTDFSNPTGTPGLVAGMQAVHDKYGTVPMKDLLQPAVDLAEEGFKVDKTLTSRLSSAQARVSSKETLLFYPGGEPIQPGEKLVQKELANTLQRIQDDGPEGFYEGTIAEAIKEETDLSLDDLRDYEVKHRKPVKGTFSGYDVWTAPPPFSGVTGLEMLKLAEEIDLDDSEGKSDYMKKLGSITNAAYQDRIDYTGDGIKADEAEQLLSPLHLKNLKDEIESGDWTNENFESEEHESTTHFVIMDQYGTVVSATNTLSNFFGSGNYTHGFFLNDQLKNFRNGLNAKDSSKRSRTFTAPTVLKKDGKETIGIGSPGGDRIPQVLMQVLYSYSQGEGTFQEIIDNYRFVFDGSVIYTESRLSDGTKSRLKNAGYDVIQKVSPMFYGGVQVLSRNEENGTITGAGDPRRNGGWESDK